MGRLKFTHYKQPDEMDCGATCLRMVAKHYGKTFSLPDLRQATQTTREGTNLLGLSDAAEKIGFRTLGVKVPFAKLVEDAPLPLIAHWNQNHFVVVYKIKQHSRFFPPYFGSAQQPSGNCTIYVADPAHGLLKYTEKEFIKSWVSDGKDEGVALLLEPTPSFYEDTIGDGSFSSPYFDSAQQPSGRSGGASFSFLYQYLFKHKRLIIQLIIGLGAGSLLQLIFPFLTQSIVDIGIQNRDVNFIYLILFAQLMVFFGRTSIDIIRNWILLHISSRINISLVSDFFVKLMKLPIAYFDSKMTGDIMQRIQDHYRIESFLTGSSLNVLFSMFNLLVFSGVLAWYNITIFLVFMFGSVLYVVWILFFLKRRADIDFKRFNQSSQNQSKVMELINGMQEIKLHNAERQKRWQWENLQVKLFKINIQGLALSQWQNSGSSVINELKNILITFLTAKLVLDGQITLGMMLSVSYITGSLNAPIIELVQFIQHWQDAKLSLQRLSEIHNKEDEEPYGKEVINDIEPNSGFHIQNLSFQYVGVGNSLVIENLTVEIPANKITAIVGSSGSGKTTLMKLLLKFYDATSGTIHLATAVDGSAPLSFGNVEHSMLQKIKIDSSTSKGLGVRLSSVGVSLWRSHCGVVMQEGYIFSDTIANNIAVGEDVVDKQKLKHAVTVANIKEFIDNLPLGYNTKIGMEGIGISTGQKQRLLIARAVYKNPDYLFFDEATSALDANNEKVIMNNLNEFFKGKTVVVVAHRLSTVKNADQIIVLDKGHIIEQGNHNELTAKRGSYYELVKNQLELGN